MEKERSIYLIFQKFYIHWKKQLILRTQSLYLRHPKSSPFTTDLLNRVTHLIHLLDLYLDVIVIYWCLF